MPNEQPPVTLAVANAMEAPILYIEGTSNCGYGNGMINVTLVANRFLPRSDGGVETVTCAVAHLRCNVAAAIALGSALEKAVLIATPPQSKAN